MAKRRRFRRSAARTFTRVKRSRGRSLFSGGGIENKLTNIGLGVAAGAGTNIAIRHASTLVPVPQIAGLVNQVSPLISAYVAYRIGRRAGMIGGIVAALPSLATAGLNLGGLLGGILGTSASGTPANDGWQ